MFWGEGVTMNDEAPTIGEQQNQNELMSKRWRGDQLSHCRVVVILFFFFDPGPLSGWPASCCLEAVMPHPGARPRTSSPSLRTPCRTKLHSGESYRLSKLRWPHSSDDSCPRDGSSQFAFSC